MATKKVIESIEVGGDDEEITEAEAPVIEPDAIGAPAPITPSSTGDQHEGRVAYENQINSDATNFAAEAFATYIDTTINGGTVEIVSTYPDQE